MLISNLKLVFLHHLTVFQRTWWTSRNILHRLYSSLLFICSFLLFSIVIFVVISTQIIYNPKYTTTEIYIEYSKIAFMLQLRLHIAKILSFLKLFPQKTCAYKMAQKRLWYVASSNRQACWTLISLCIAFPFLISSDGTFPHAHHWSH